MVPEASEVFWFKHKEKGQMEIYRRDKRTPFPQLLTCPQGEDYTHVDSALWPNYLSLGATL